MSIVYPLSMPTSKAPKRVSFYSASLVSMISSAFTLQQQVQALSGQAWGADITLPTMDRSEAEEWISFLLALNGREGTFLLGDPKGKTPQGTALGSPVLDGDHDAGAVVLSVTGFTASQTQALAQGDWLQVSTRLHKVVYADVVADGSGDALIHIWPRLREQNLSGTPILTANTTGVFRLRENAGQYINISGNGLYDIAFSASEAF